jgi:hypothetical protein
MIKISNLGAFASACGLEIEHQFAQNQLSDEGEPASK